MLGGSPQKHGGKRGRQEDFGLTVRDAGKINYPTLPNYEEGWGTRSAIFLILMSDQLHL
jgi:hypothetical protein